MSIVPRMHSIARKKRVCIYVCNSEWAAGSDSAAGKVTLDLASNGYITDINDLTQRTIT